jgi:hypothetical protein
LTDLINIHNHIPLNALAREIWIKTFYYTYVENIWNNVDVWRFISMFSILLLIFYKKKIRFFHSKEEKIEQDKNNFISSDLLLTENFFREFLIELSINESYNKFKYDKIKNFVDYYEQDDNQYLNPVLKESVQNFCNNLKNLLEFLDKHFTETHIHDLYRLYADLKHDPEFNYLYFQEQLNKFCRGVETAYTEYRLIIRSKLYI